MSITGDQPRTPAAPHGPRPKGHSFTAEIDVSEIDERGRVTMPWACRTVELSRSHLVILSRRVTFPGRRMLVAVHLVDEAPMPLFGSVVSCTYAADGMHRIDLDLQPLPPGDTVQTWAKSRTR
ncbi:MAG: hypothetical protein IT439_01115 [Phycisphaerales bacterium]|nr:hypothetical protein [Phycisphaerales bacterium]